MMAIAALVSACHDEGAGSSSADACNALACGAADASFQPPATDGAPAIDATTHIDTRDGNVEASAESDADCAQSACSDAGTACSDSSTCDDGNPCTVDECMANVCVHSFASDGTPCDDGQLCTVGDTCRSGTCAGVPRSDAARLGATAYTFGGAYVLSDFEGSRGGLARFASPDRVLFADRLDSDATLLTVANITTGTLQLVGQTVTDSLLQLGQLNGWVWQAIPVSHLVPLPDDRFALFSASRIQVFRVMPDGAIVELWQATRSAEYVYDAAWAGDSIWTCRAGTIDRYVLQSDGSLLATPAPDLAPFVGCVRMAVAPDGVTVYASNPRSASPGVFRWSAGTGPSIAAEVVLPGVTPIDMAIDDTHLALQKIAAEGDFGDTEVYRLADFARVAAFSQTAMATPFSLALSSGNLFLEWTRTDAASERVTGAVYRLGDTGATPLSEWTLRTRASVALDPWGANVERLTTAGTHIVTAPWQHVADLDALTGSPTWITGPGHGEIVGIHAAGDVVATYSPYSMERLDLSSGIRFSAGGMVLSADVQALEVVLPEEGVPPSSFEPTPPSDQQRSETETVTALRPSASAGLEVAGVFSLDGGPARLVRRKNRLYQVAAVGASDYRIRSFTLGPSIVGQAPLAPDAEIALTVSRVPSDWGRRYTFEPDVDVDRNQIAITEVWSGGEATAIRNSVVWASLREGSAIMVARAALDTPASPLVRGDRLMLFGSSQATFATADGAGGLTVIARADCSVGCGAPLGIDIAGRVYVPYLDTDYRPDLAIFSAADGAVFSRLALPDAPKTAARAGDRIVLAASHSVTTLEPSCGPPDDGGTSAGDASPDDSAADAQGDGATTCGPIAHCPDGGPMRSAVVGDANGDGCVDANDLALVTSCVGVPVIDPCGTSFLADLDGNGTVDIRDYLRVVGNQGHGCDAGP